VGIAGNTNDDFENAAVPLTCHPRNEGLTAVLAKKQDLIVFDLKIGSTATQGNYPLLATAGFNGEGKWRRVVALHLLQEPAPHKELLPIRQEL